MSVLIMGMKMPKSCMDCPLFESLYHFHGCHAKPESFNDRDMWNFAVGDRPSWCPLVEVSAPHGRLIDADALLNLLNNCVFPSDMVTTTAVRMAMNWIKDSPTVIEAEDGDSDV